MGKTIGRFGFELSGVTSGSSQEGELSLEMPTIEIGLKQWTTSDSGMHLVIPECRSEREIDANIKLLKDDLDAVASQAKAVLRREEARLAAQSSK
ncbi:hypothetical protein NKJ40_09835 [Mesorhizobium sp. M0119]|uniref:hypothetical protein n=1 Tax=unclassified Mesorhizobium TaxID=325217 RepID=UPI00333C0C01